MSNDNRLQGTLITSVSVVLVAACGPSADGTDGGATSTEGSSSTSSSSGVSASDSGSPAESSGGPADTTGPGIESRCGNGILEGDEDCDDGNLVEHDGCPTNCRDPFPVKIAVGNRHVCVAEGSQLRCWGDGAQAGLGSGQTSGCSAAGVYACTSGATCCIGDDEPPSRGPLHVFDQEIVQLDAGTNTCVVFADGRLGCWGPGYHGVLGPDAFAACGGTTDCGSDPGCCIGDDEPATDAVMFDFGIAVRQVAVGDAHVCTLLDDRTVRCWGAGALGRLGYGDELDRGDDEPVESLPPVEVGGPVTSIAAGALASCAGLEEPGLRCWGACAGPDGVDTRCLGQPGDPDLQPPIGDDDVPADYPAIILASEDALVFDVDVGRYHTCAVVDDQEHAGTGYRRFVVCWGDDIDGAIGLPFFQRPADPELQQLMDVLNGQAGLVSVGASHACAAVPEPVHVGPLTEVMCWGRAQLGATGYGDTENPGQFQPVEYYGGVALPPTVAVETGDELTCAVTADEEIYCWGAAAGPSGIDGAHGHPGLGNIGDDETPMDVGPVSVW